MASPHASRGFSLVEVMISTLFLVVGLMAVVGTTTTTSLLRKRGIEEDRVFTGMIGRMEWIRGELFSDSDLQEQVEQATTGGGALQVAYVLDQDGDGVQDVSAAPGDQVTPVIQVTIDPAPPFLDPDLLLRVQMTASWYGAGGNRSLSIQSLVANRTGYSG